MGLLWPPGPTSRAIATTLWHRERLNPRITRRPRPNWSTASPPSGSMAHRNTWLPPPSGRPSANRPRSSSSPSWLPTAQPPSCSTASPRAVEWPSLRHPGDFSTVQRSIRQSPRPPVSISSRLLSIVHRRSCASMGFRSPAPPPGVRTHSPGSPSGRDTTASNGGTAPSAK